MRTSGPRNRVRSVSCFRELDRRRGLIAPSRQTISLSRKPRMIEASVEGAAAVDWVLCSLSTVVASRNVCSACASCRADASAACCRASSAAAPSILNVPVSRALISCPGCAKLEQCFFRGRVERLECAAAGNLGKDAGARITGAQHERDLFVRKRLRSSRDRSDESDGEQQSKRAHCSSGSTTCASCFFTDREKRGNKIAEFRFCVRGFGRELVRCLR